MEVSMKKWLSNRKVQAALVGILFLLGIGTFAYYTYQQHHFDELTEEKQETAIRVMKQKEQSSTNHKAAAESSRAAADIKKSKLPKELFSKIHPEVVDVSRADYTGKDVKPLTVEAMEKVNAVKVVESLGVGTIEIPSISMKLPILEGVSQSNLSVGAGTMKAGQELKKRNFALAGHYMTNAGLLFGGIKNVKPGDLIQLVYQNEQSTYKVTKTQVISKDDGYVTFDSEGEGLLTLITCDRAVIGTNNRFMVRAELVE